MAVITKQAVRDWIEKMVVTRRKEVYQEIGDIVDERLNPVLDELVAALPGVDKLEEAGRSFYRAVEAYADQPYFRDYQHVVQHMLHTAERYGENIKKLIRHDIRTRVVNYVSGGNAITTQDTCGSEAVVALAHEIARELRPKYNLVNDLSRLHKELQNIVSQAASGKEALKLLQEAGVDTSSFTVEQRNLPVAVNLSVDPKILASV